MSTSLGNSHLTSYLYTPLLGDDIRLIRLLPGAEAEDIYVNIVHRALIPLPVASEQDQLSPKDVDETLPDGWKAFKTPEGRWLFERMDEDNSACQYDHPSSDSVPPELYEALRTNSTLAGQTMNGDGHNQFEALSYVWGDATVRDILYVVDSAGDMSPGHVPITHSLRQADGPRLLWVDAVCINQQDDVERNAQVLRMGDIYSLAQRVVVWLGEASDDSALALKTMQYLGRQIEISQGGWQHRPPDAQESQWIDQDYKLPYSADEWASLTALMGRAWFRRVWVLQEVSVANPNAVVQCGPDSISLPPRCHWPSHAKWRS